MGGSFIYQKQRAFTRGLTATVYIPVSVCSDGLAPHLYINTCINGAPPALTSAMRLELFARILENANLRNVIDWGVWRNLDLKYI